MSVTDNRKVNRCVVNYFYSASCQHDAAIWHSQEDTETTFLSLPEDMNMCLDGSHVSCSTGHNIRSLKYDIPEMSLTILNRPGLVVLSALVKGNWTPNTLFQVMAVLDNMVPNSYLSDINVSDHPYNSNIR